MLLFIDETWLPEPLTCGVICLWELMRSTLYKSKKIITHRCKMTVEKIPVIHFIITFGFCKHSHWLAHWLES